MARLALGSALTVWLMASTASAWAQPLGVFVAAEPSRGREKPSEAERQQNSSAYQAADKARKDLEKTLKAQHGNKRETWPEAALLQLGDLEDARNRANADWQFRTEAEPVTEDWRVTTAQAMGQRGNTGKKEHITPASSSAAAHLVVTITGLRNPSAAINAADDRCLRVRLERGSRISAEQFARVPATYRPPSSKVKRLARPSEDSPSWQFEACGLHPYFDPEEEVANMVDRFVKDNRAALTDAASQ